MRFHEGRIMKVREDVLKKVALELRNDNWTSQSTIGQYSRHIGMN